MGGVYSEAEDTADSDLARGERVRVVDIAEGIIRSSITGDLVLEPVWPHEDDPPEDLVKFFVSLINKRVKISVKVGDSEPVREVHDARIN